jgi:hypothetical protein
MGGYTTRVKKTAATGASPYPGSADDSPLFSLE